MQYKTKFLTRGTYFLSSKLYIYYRLFLLNGIAKQKEAVKKKYKRGDMYGEGISSR